MKVVYVSDDKQFRVIARYGKFYPQSIYDSKWCYFYTGNKGNKIAYTTILIDAINW